VAQPLSPPLILFGCAKFTRSTRPYSSAAHSEKRQWFAH
jgi:hypothetical protein